MKLTNNEITKIYSNLIEAFKESEDVYYPIKFSFPLGKNQKILEKYNQEIIEARNKILLHYGEFDEQGNLKITQMDIVQQELNELSNIVEEIPLMGIPYECLSDDLHLTQKQINSIIPFVVD